MMTKGDKAPHAVIAAAKDDARFKAVEVRKQDGVVEVLWAKSLAATGQTWTAFAALCGIPDARDGHDKAARRQPASVVVQLWVSELASAVSLNPRFSRLNQSSICPHWPSARW